MTHLFESILADLQTIPATILRVTGAWFDPDVHGLPPLKMKAKTGNSSNGNNGPKPYLKIHPIAGRNFGERIDEDGQLVWENLAYKTQSQSARSAHITDFDRDEIEREGMDEEKAEVIKPLWSAVMSNTQIVTAIGRDGFGLTTVKAYTSAFSSALTAELAAVEDMPGQFGSITS